MRIGLTGARGVLGTRIHSALSDQGHEIIPFGDDIRDSGALDAWAIELDAAVHAAAIVPVREVMNQLSDAIAVNVAGTANVARAVAKVPNCHLTYISTSHVYASSDRPLKEDDALKPASLYGLTKLQGEQWASALLERMLIIRVFSFFDERQPESYLVPSLRARIMSASPGSSMELEGAQNVRDIADARWMAEVCARLIDINQIGTVNCATGVGHTVIEIARRLAKALDRTDVSWRFDKSSSVSSLTANVDTLINHIGPLPTFDLESSLSRFANAVRQ